MINAIRGINEPLPPGERVLWQGAPRWTALFLHTFHARLLAAYFGALMLLRGAFFVGDGGSVIGGVTAALWLLPLGLVVVGLVALLSWLTERTTIYAITDQRVVMRIGVVLSMTLNLPFKVIETAGLRQFSDGSGDVPLTLAGADRIAWLHLWPHVRPWKVAHPEPMLRAVPEAAAVADLLARALADFAGDTRLRTAAVTRSNAVGGDRPQLVAAR